MLSPVAGVQVALAFTWPYRAQTAEGQPREPRILTSVLGRRLTRSERPCLDANVETVPRARSHIPHG